MTTITFREEVYDCCSIFIFLVQQYYEDAAASVKMAHSAIPQNLSASSSVSSGIVTATDVEDTYDIEEEEDDQVSLGLESIPSIESPESIDTVVGEDESIHISESARVQTMGLEGAQSEGENVNAAAVIRQSNNERSSSDSVNSPNAAVAQSCVEKQNAKLNFEGAVRSDSAVDESGSSGSEESHESKEGNVTDDSESTVVANEGESGQSSPSDGSGSGSGTKIVREEPTALEVFEGQESAGMEEVGVEVKDAGELDELQDALLEFSMEVDVDKDREDSGMGDVHEDTKKAGIVERKNESLKLIVSKQGGKDLDPSKSDFLTSSQTEYSSDYASNSTGSAVSTPTDVLKREPLLIDTNPLMGKDMNDPENVFQVTRDQDSDWSGMSMPGQLDEGESAAVVLERAQLTSLEPEVSTKDILLQKTQL